MLRRGAGHSYTDAALHTSGMGIDLKPMRRMLARDAALGIMRVEPGVTLSEDGTGSLEGWLVAGCLTI